MPLCIHAGRLFGVGYVIFAYISRAILRHFLGDSILYGGGVPYWRCAFGAIVQLGVLPAMLAALCEHAALGRQDTRGARALGLRGCGCVYGSIVHSIVHLWCCKRCAVRLSLRRHTRRAFVPFVRLGGSADTRKFDLAPI
jgi:hypothetical protein